MIGVFIQTNLHTKKGRACPNGYILQGGGCWEWVGPTNGRGYGVTYYEGKRCYAHRFMYIQSKGAIPAGLQLDHLCRNPACVNPDHLEVVTSRENNLRGTWGGRTECLRGHPYDEANTYRDGKSRRCRACARDFQRRRKIRLRAA